MLKTRKILIHQMTKRHLIVQMMTMILVVMMMDQWQESSLNKNQAIQLQALIEMKTILLVVNLMKKEQCKKLWVQVNLNQCLNNKTLKKIKKIISAWLKMIIQTKTNPLLKKKKKKKHQKRKAATKIS